MNKQTLGKFDQNTSLKKGIVVCLLTAAVLISMVGMAQAQDPYWYLKDDVSTVSGANHTMVKGSGQGSTYEELGSGDSEIWVADEAATIDVSFLGGAGTSWEIVLDYANKANNGWLNIGETITMEIGSYDPDSKTFTVAMTETDDGTSEGKGSTAKTISPGTAFTVPTGDYLALRLTMSSGAGDKVHIDVTGDVSGNSRSYLQCIGTGGCIDYPVPELSTLVLLSFGLLALAGFVLYGRSRRRNGKAQ